MDNPANNPDDDTSPTKKKKKRGSSNISRKVKGGKKKRHIAGATTEPFRGTNASSNTSTSISEGVGDNIIAGPPATKEGKHQRRERSHRDKERRSASKLTKNEEKVRSLVGVVNHHEQREKDQSFLDKIRDAREESILASAEKSKDALEQRIDRFDSSTKKKDAENKHQKSKLKVEIAAVRMEGEAMIQKVNEKARQNVSTLKKKGEESLSKSRSQSARARKKEKVSLSIFPLFTLIW